MLLSLSPLISISVAPGIEPTNEYIDDTVGSRGPRAPILVEGHNTTIITNSRNVDNVIVMGNGTLIIDEFGVLII